MALLCFFVVATEVIPVIYFLVHTTVVINNTNLFACD